MIKAFLSSPYRSHVLFDSHGTSPPFRDAMCSMLATGLQIVFAVSEIQGYRSDCIWSPLIEGEILRADGTLQGEDEALQWCKYNLEFAGFTHLINSSGITIPTKPGYGVNSCDILVSFAHRLGIEVISEPDFTGIHP